jgi:hypothetical protein
MREMLMRSLRGDIERADGPRLRGFWPVEIDAGEFVLAH